MLVRQKEGCGNHTPTTLSFQGGNTMAKAIGIDLGTSNSAASVMETTPLHLETTLYY